MPIATVASGILGVQQALVKNNIIVIVDILRFSSTVTTAIANGFTIIPCSNHQKAAEISSQIGIPCSGKTGKAQYSLSPLDYINPKYSEEVLLVSPNGAACTELVSSHGISFIGCFLNARTVGRLLHEMSNHKNLNITLIAADEVQEDQYDDIQTRRFALEDYLACGYLLSELKIDLTSEAVLCKRAYESSSHDYDELIKNSMSGRYLIEHGHGADLSHCLQKNIYEILPIIKNNKIVRYTT